MSKEFIKSTEAIKKKIVSANRRGLCNKDGESVLGSDGQLTAKPTPAGGAKVYVFRKNKWVLKNSLDN